MFAYDVSVSGGVLLWVWWEVGTGGVFGELWEAGLMLGREGMGGERGERGEIR